MVPSRAPDCMLAMVLVPIARSGTTSSTLARRAAWLTSASIEIPSPGAIAPPM
jgi:hypothetical protein